MLLKNIIEYLILLSFDYNSIFFIIAFFVGFGKEEYK
jgi:hypothetical protein